MQIQNHAKNWVRGTGNPRMNPACKAKLEYFIRSQQGLFLPSATHPNATRIALPPSAISIPTDHFTELLLRGEERFLWNIEGLYTMVIFSWLMGCGDSL
jgi:hypothetical protein